MRDTEDDVRGDRMERTLGIVLVAIGAVLLLARLAGLGGEIVVATIGAGFAAAYAVTRLYVLLIPGGILLGLGGGIVVIANGGPDSAPVLGLGLGFLAIALVDRLVTAAPRAGWWWPIIPGGLLTGIGALALPWLAALRGYLVPILLIVVGIALVLSRPGRQRSGD